MANTTTVLASTWTAVSSVWLPLLVGAAFVGLCIFIMSKLKLHGDNSESSPRRCRNTPERVTTTKTGRRYAVMGNGFVGSHVVEGLLARGESNIVVVDCYNSGLFDGERRVKFVQGDICDTKWLREQIRGVQTVFHTVARISLQHSKYDFDLCYRTNCIGTDSVIEACRQEGVEILVFSSSVETVKNRTQPFTGNESAPYLVDPPSNYSLTKSIAERAILNANRTGGYNLRTAALRLNSIWGPRDNYFVTRTAASPILISVVAPNSLRDWNYVENVAHAFYKCEEAMLGPNASAVEGKAFFIADGRPISVTTFYNMAAEVFGKRLLMIPFFVLRSVGVIVDIALMLSPGCTTGETSTPGLDVMDAVIYSKSSLAHEAFGYTELYSIEDGLRASLHFHQAIEARKKQPKASTSSSN